MDVFSNILFVKEQSAALSQLAHRAVTTDKYSPEACCVTGNYFSLKVGGGRRVVEGASQPIMSERPPLVRKGQHEHLLTPLRGSTSAPLSTSAERCD